MAASFQSLANFIWSVADILRGPYRPPQYERVMLPMTVLRRFDCVLELTKAAVIERYNTRLKGKSDTEIDPILNRVAGDGADLGFHNHSNLDFHKLKGDPDNIGRHLTDYIAGFSENVRKIFGYFEFEKEIEKLEEANRLYLIVSKFAEMDLSPENVDNISMGLIFEDLIRRFNEAANETAGDHFTPREVIQLMVSLLLEPDGDTLTKEGLITTVCDPACGTGGMLSEAQNWIRAHNSGANVYVFGQDYNPRSYSVAASDLLIKGYKESKIEFGDTLVDDKFSDKKFDYLLANPPFGVDWKAQKKQIDHLPNFRGYSGKLPRVNDGAFLFLIHMIGHFEKYDPDNSKKGSRCAIVFNGSPLFTGGAGSGESEIRRWIIENDWLEAIVALPEQMFFNTGIGTFIWIVTNRKSENRKGKIQLLDSRERWKPMKKSLGNKRRYLTPEIIDQLSKEHGDFINSDEQFTNTETSKVYDNNYFGYRRITVERPLRLRFQIVDEAKEQFLDACPEFLDAVMEMEQEFGFEPYDDWNEAWLTIQGIVKRSGVKWTTANKKLFRQSFTVVDAEAKRVKSKTIKSEKINTSTLFPNQVLPELITVNDIKPILGMYPDLSSKSAKHVEYESDPNLRDFENIPLKEDIITFFQREVQPFVPDAWIKRDVIDEKDGGIGKVGYEINFNREFYRFEPPRPLEEINAELEVVEKTILNLLNEVTK